MSASSKRSTRRDVTGRLRIGDDWNAIHIIALSQSNPLKAVAELIENSIDAGARTITFVRGRERGQAYLKVIDDGEGVPLDDDGRPNFKHVATHICDSLKRRLKARGIQGVQGEFGIGLLSFWTVGETLSMISAGDDAQTYEMRMARDDPNYTVTKLRRLVPQVGVELTIRPLLAGIRQFSGEKLQWYLASELRDRIRRSGVEIVIVDRQARTEYRVQPREFSGQLLHQLPSPVAQFGDVYVELYLADSDVGNRVGLYRSGTRVVESLAEFPELDRPPWTSGVVQGVLDAPFLNLTPGTRLGVIRDERFAALIEALAPLEHALGELIEQQRRAAEERTNRTTLQAIQRAFREALLALPREDYDWFDVDRERAGRGSRTGRGGSNDLADDAASADGAAIDDNPPVQREFFEHPGPLHKVQIAPAACVVSIGQSKRLHALARDGGGRQVDADLTFAWRIVEGEAALSETEGELVTLAAPQEPQLVRVAVVASQAARTAEAQSLVTVTDSLLPERPKSDARRGLPEYTFEKRPGELWRSRYDVAQNVVVVNNGHRDFVYASRAKSTKLRYLCRLFAKELVLHNFPGYAPEELLERMIELSLYTEESLR